MNAFTLILRSLRFYARAHLGVLLGATVGSAALIGALVVGDSVRESLRDLALARLGHVELAMSGGDRFFRAQLGGNKIAAAIQLTGIASAQDSSTRANQVQILGVGASFWQLANQPPPIAELPPDTVVLNAPLAQQLNAKAGDTILLRLAKPSLLSRDALISPQSDSIALRVKVQSIVNDDQFGRFSLQANQVAPFNAFVGIDWLQQKIGMSNRANLLLVPQFQRFSGSWEGPVRYMDKSAALRLRDYISTIDNAANDANSTLMRDWQLSDAQLQLRQLPDNGGVELRSDRVFIDAPIVAAAKKISPQAQPVLTYFVNELHSAPFSTPYSMVTAIGPPITPPDMRDDEIILNEWEADDLQANPGDDVRLRYYVIGNGRALTERTNNFRVRKIIPLAGAADDRGFMPDFPGIAEAESSSDWDAGFTIDFTRIRPKDEQYWKEHRGTPKAFVSLRAGQSMWTNRFGDCTAIRFPASAGSLETIRSNLLATISPASVGLSFQPVREQALAASSQAVDFGQLFIGFSMFLIAAALLLMGLLFQFGLEARAREIGTLLAVGFKPKQVRRLFLGEGALLALIGGIVGALGGLIYAKAMLLGLATIWRGAVGTSALRFHCTITTLVIGTLASTVVSIITIWFALRKQARRPARELLADGAEENVDVGRAKLRLRPNIRAAAQHRPTRTYGTWIGPLATLLAGITIGWAFWNGDRASADTFFSGGALMLIGGLGFCAALLARAGRRDLGRARCPSAPTDTNGGQGTARPTRETVSEHNLTFRDLAWRNCGRRRKRSLATIALLACGVFLIVAIGAFRIDSTRDDASRSSGTGGFLLIGESTVPVTYDLNSQAGRDFYGLDTPVMRNLRVIQMRVHDGDEASCLNLNRAQRPRILGVDPKQFQLRNSFTFADAVKSETENYGWLMLNGTTTNQPDLVGRAYSRADTSTNQAAAAREYARPTETTTDEIPAIGDENSIVWAMGKKIGDVVEYTDGYGKPLKLRLVGALANSILQGNLIINEEDFIKHFPDDSGYRMFLVDGPSNAQSEISSQMTRALRDNGLELTPTSQRLNAFNAVQNTYLSTFQVLGGLGLLLGTVGLGVVVLRNVQERRRELALMLAVGFRRRSLEWLVLFEHAVLLALGLVVGMIAAVLGVLPALMSPGAHLPVLSLTLTLGAVLASGLLWTWLATRFALRGKLLDALKEE